MQNLHAFNHWTYDQEPTVERVAGPAFFAAHRDCRCRPRANDLLHRLHRLPDLQKKARFSMSFCDQGFPVMRHGGTAPVDPCSIVMSQARNAAGDYQAAPMGEGETGSGAATTDRTTYDPDIH